MTESVTNTFVAPDVPTRRPTKLIVGGLVLVIVVGFLIFTSIGGSTTDYRTVAQVLAAGPSEEIIRISGQVSPGSIEWDPRTLILRFSLRDETGQMPAVYHGVRPDMFRDGADLVAEGRYTADGVFQVTNLILKCPSKYEEAATATAEVP